MPQHQLSSPASMLGWCLIAGTVTPHQLPPMLLTDQEEGPFLSGWTLAKGLNVGTQGHRPHHSFFWLPHNTAFSGQYRCHSCRVSLPSQGVPTVPETLSVFDPQLVLHPQNQCWIQVSCSHVFPRRTCPSRSHWRSF